MMSKQAFTLIELLVVVLIIGILAAIAVPQYNKAVEKARAAEAITVLNTLQKGIDMYLLENGLPADNDWITFLGASVPRGENDPSSYFSHPLDIDLGGSLRCTLDVENTGYCYSKDFVYYAYCTSVGCELYAFRGTQQEWEEDEGVVCLSCTMDGKYNLYKKFDLGKWTQRCYGNCPSGLVW